MFEVFELFLEELDGEGGNGVVGMRVSVVLEGSAGFVGKLIPVVRDIVVIFLFDVNIHSTSPLSVTFKTSAICCRDCNLILVLPAFLMQSLCQKTGLESWERRK